MSQDDVAKATGLSVPTIKRVESDRQVSISADAVATVRRALEDAGVIFVEENGEGPGVRLKKRKGVKTVHPKPSGPATEVVDMMDAAIEEHRLAKRSKS